MSFETLAQTLLAAGEPDQFAAALGAAGELRRRMQLKTLLFGMGETFRVLLQRKVEDGDGGETGGKRLNNEKGPENRGLEWNLFAALFQGAPRLLLLLRSSLFLRGGFLGCALHRLILPNIKFCDSKIAM